MKNYAVYSLTRIYGISLLLIALLFVSRLAEGQMLQANDGKIFRALPNNLPLPSTPLRYHITTDYFNRTFQGVFVDKLRVGGNLSGTYHCKQGKGKRI